MENALDSVTYHSQFMASAERSREASASRLDLVEKRSKLRNKLWELPTDAAEREALDIEIGLIDAELSLIDAERDEIQAERDKLELAKLEGFDYVRPGRLISRLLPAIPVGTKEIDEAIYKGEPASLYWRRSFLIVGAIALIVIALCFMMPSIALIGIMTPLGATTTQTVNVLLMAAYFVLFSAILGTQLMRSPAFSRMTVITLSKYLLGAEQWTWSQRLRSCLVYSVAHPMILLAPIVLIPVRFILMYFVMGMYLRRTTSSSQSPAIAAAATMMHTTVRILTIAFCLVYMAGVAILLLV